MKKIVALLCLVAAFAAGACTSAEVAQDSTVVGCGGSTLAVAMKTDFVFDMSSVFVTRYPVEQYVAMKLQDRPSFAEMRNAAIYKGIAYIAVLGSVIKIDAATGKILAFSNPSKLTDPKYVVVQNNLLFVASGDSGEGVYQVNLATEQIEVVYNQASIQNLNVFNDGTYVWVGTFNGVGRIDPKTHTIKFYSTASELNSPCDRNNVRMHVRGVEVWAEVIANAYCSGAALHYNRANDSWIPYGVEAFAPNQKSRIDFDTFIVSDVGVFAEYTIELPLGVVEEIKKFDPMMGTWTLIGSGIINSDPKSLEALEQQLPPVSSYRDVLITQVDPFDQYKIQIHDGNDWIGTRYGAAELVMQSITKNPIANNYLIVNHTGLYIMSLDDVVPKSVVNTHALTYSTEEDLTFTADNQMLVVHHPYLEMVGNGEYQFIVYDQAAQSGFGFALPMNSEKYEPVATKTLVQNGSKLIFTSEYGSFEIDLVAKTVVKTK